MRTIIAPVVGVLVAAAAAVGQTVPPALMVREGDRSVPLAVSTLVVEARIIGAIAETKITMTFANPNDRALAGDLYFPLPEGATVSGYALDIQGVMVDGVVVEKDRGRQVFESVVRQGIDPGLIEWTKGNNFKTRVFPIPARGTRTVRVEYVSDVTADKDGTSYHLPLRFKDKIKDVSLVVSVVRPGAPPMVKQAGDGLANFKFAEWQDGFVAKTELKDAAFGDDLVIALPSVEKQPVQVEKGPDGETYFCLNEFPVAPAAADTGSSPAPKAVTILWDASASRGQTDHTREFALIKDYFAAIKGAVAVDLVLFRDTAAPAKRFQVKDGDAGALIAELTRVAYDGGTQMSAISPAGAETCDFYLLFSDGLSNFGREEPAGLKWPVYCLSADATANHSFLRALAMETGGVYFNLKKVENAAVLAALPGTGRRPFSFLAAEVDKAKVQGVYPRLTQPVQGRFSLVGKLLGNEATVTMQFGPAGGQPSASIERTVAKKDAVEGSLLRRYWAQQKVAELMIFPERNEEDLVTVGRMYGLVTPYTSLIVLENLAQYLQYHIPPPATLPDLRKAYDARVVKEELDKEKQRKEKLERVVGLWQQRVKWWETEFKYAKDFKFKEPAAAGRDGSTSQPADVRTALRELAIRDPMLQTEAAPPPPGAAPRGPDGGQTGERGLDKDGKDGGRAAEPGVVIKAWDPKTPYIAALKAASPDKVFDVYMDQRRQFGTSPAFFFDCADFLFRQNQDPLGTQVLSNIAELELENAALLRILGYKLSEEDQLDLAVATFETVLKQRPEEPQSYRDLALVLARRGERTRSSPDLRRACELLTHVVLNTWDRFEEIEVIALMELNALLPKAKALGAADVALDPRLVKLLDLDVRIILTWDADLTDIDLWVVEPSGEKAYYGHNRTTIGGAVSKDFTQGYGPEEYILRKAMKGMYKVQTNFFGSSAQSVQGAVTLQVDIFTNFGRPNEKRRTITVRLSEKKETIDIGEMEF